MYLIHKILWTSYFYNCLVIYWVGQHVLCTRVSFVITIIVFRYIFLVLVHLPFFFHLHVGRKQNKPNSNGTKSIQFCSDLDLTIRLIGVKTPRELSSSTRHLVMISLSYMWLWLADPAFHFQFSHNRKCRFHVRPAAYPNEIMVVHVSTEWLDYSHNNWKWRNEWSAVIWRDIP